VCVCACACVCTCVCVCVFLSPYVWCGEGPHTDKPCTDSIAAFVAVGVSQPGQAVTSLGCVLFAFVLCCVCTLMHACANKCVCVCHVSVCLSCVMCVCVCHLCACLLCACASI